jgi:endonuclease/exonuclease/phosphatase family metal-dependent hydrolase
MGNNSLSRRSKALLFFLLLGLASFDVIAQPLVQPRGTDTTFDLVTWNVHEFPGSGFRTIDTLAVLINDLDIDIVGMQEIADTNAFYQLLERLPGWDGLFAPYDYSGYPYLKTGVLWRTDRATVDYLEQLFVGYQYQFPRPPIHVYATVDFGQYQFDFHLIVLHLKAGDTDDDRLRRQAAVLMLKAYLDNNIPGAPDQDWIVIGDWNDELDDEQSQNVFWPLLADSLNYRFLTLPLAGNPYWASYPSFNSLIDHLMISAFASDEYGSGNTITLRLDDEYSNYGNRISDHRPVMSQFLGYYTGVDEILPDDFELFTAYPNPFNGATSLSFYIEQPSNVNLEIFDILGRKVATLQRGWLVKGIYRVDLSGDGTSSGIYFARLQYLSKSQTIKLTLLK